ncbi:CYIR protein [Plasmodium cynomolgi strain B]|uniref:CYIR protein n=1 Tax=Plasmodium cynomolgi (strain B) TaxID=1120755 RepID=K6VJA0_PLACD|nr:CYIR protein [Plasmodium cynomolgi strain B]GAB69477.1 CYIR protein [Plasmodium cynomolgi strain B]
MSLNVQEKLSKVLPSRKIYAIFNDDSEDSKDNCIYCKIDDAFKNTYDGLEVFCKKFEKSLKHIFDLNVNTAAGSTNGPAEKDTPEEIDNFKDNCLFLKYWVFHEINKMKNKWMNLNIIPVIDKLNYIQYHLNASRKINVCYNNYNEYINYSEEEKVLYEYFKDFDAIKNYINSVNNKDHFLDYINKIKKFTRKKDEEHCCHINYPLCYSYFQCHPKYDPDNLLHLLNSKVEKPTPIESGKIGSNNDTGKTTKPGKKEYRTTIHNVKCLINYGARNEGYAFVSCYNIGKGYPNVEHIFTPTEEEIKKASEETQNHNNVSKDKEQKGSQILYNDDLKSQSEASNTGGTVVKTTSPKIGIPESLRGYTFLGEYVRRNAGEKYGKYQLGRSVAQLFSGIGNTHNRGNTEVNVNCSNSRIEKGNLKCINLEDENEKYKYENEIIKRSNSSSEDVNTGVFNEESQYNLLDTEYFRIASVATLFLGFIFVFFLYFKVYTNYISKYKHALFSKNYICNEL